MASKLDVMNAALVLCGTQQIASESDSRPQALAARQFFNSELRAMLTTVPFPFAYRESGLVANYDTAALADFVPMFDDTTVRDAAYDGSHLYLTGVQSGSGVILTLDAEGAVEQTMASTDPRGVTWDHQELLVIGGSPGTLFVLSNGLLQEVGPTGITNVAAFAWHRGELYAVNGGRSMLYNVDRNSGQAREIGPIGLYGARGLGSDGNLLYSFANATAGATAVPTLWRLNTRTAAPRRVATVDDDAPAALTYMDDSFIIAGKDALRDMTVSASNDVEDRFVVPEDFLRLWSWEDGDRRRQRVVVRGDVMIARTPDAEDFMLRYVSDDVRIEEADALFVQLLQIKIARRLAVKYAKDPLLPRDLIAEERLLMMQAATVAREQREEEPVELATNVGRNDQYYGYGNYGYGEATGYGYRGDNLGQ